MNCFQIVYLSGSLTTNRKKLIGLSQLWIAFKLYIYRVLWQPLTENRGYVIRCELLSNCIFIGFFDNRHRSIREPRVVVNCFQIVYLSGSLTTYKNFLVAHGSLWIAFKLYIYRVLWQQNKLRITTICSCELLSNCIFIGFFDNPPNCTVSPLIVVNCFQIVYLSGSLTTFVQYYKYLLMLWIAFKLYIYRVLWQP